MAKKRKFSLGEHREEGGKRKRLKNLSSKKGLPPNSLNRGKQRFVEEGGA